MTDALTPPPEVDRTMIREWILDRIKTDEFLLSEFHNNAEFHERVIRLSQCDDNQEATDFLISQLLGADAAKVRMQVEAIDRQEQGRVGGISTDWR